MRSRLTYSNAVATLALFVALGGGAYGATAALSSAHGQLRLCVARGGTLRVTSGKHCRKHQRLVVINKRGPKGAAGAPGVPGTNASLAGVPAGGDLTGSYPSPAIAPGAVTLAKTDAQWAVVSSAESIVEQSGGITLISAHSAPGDISLDFGRSLVGRSIQLTVLSTNDDSGGPNAWGSVTICGATGSDALKANCSSEINNDHTAVITTFDPFSNLPSAHTFLITVH